MPVRIVINGKVTTAPRWLVALLAVALAGVIAAVILFVFVPLVIGFAMLAVVLLLAGVVIVGLLRLFGRSEPE